MASLGRRKISQMSPNHPFASTFVSFGKKPSANSNAESPAQNVAQDDPMLPAMNGLEEAMLKQAADWISRNTGSQPPAPSQPLDATTPATRAKD